MTQCIAHRGFSACYPENTMLAFQKAVETGCHGIELDVQLTSDGQAVILHDETVDRTTNGRGPVHTYSLSDLQALDASGDFSLSCGPQKIPTLAEYFSYIKSFPVFTNIELKNSEYYYAGLEKEVIRLVREFHLEDRVIFSSFNNASILLCHQLAPEISAGFLCTVPVENCGAYAQACGVQYIHPEYSSISPEEIQKCAALGVGINAWTVNRPLHMQWLIRQNISGIITNHPDVCMKLLSSSDSF